MDSVNLAMSFMNDGRESSPRSISSSRFSHSPVSSGEVSGCSPSRRITCTPFSVAMQRAAVALDVAHGESSRSMIAARVAGVPMPESFIASRSSASSMSLPAVSIAASSDASV